MLSPVVEQLQAAWQAQVQFGQVDVHTQMRLALRYGVMSAPMLMLFRAGQPVARLHGYAPLAKIMVHFQAYLEQQP